MVTVNPFGKVPVWVSGLVTVTLRVPTVAVEVMVRLAVSCVAELKVHEFTVIPAPSRAGSKPAHRSTTCPA